MHCLEYHQILVLKKDSFQFFFQGFMGPVYTADIWENFSVTDCSNVIKCISTTAYIKHGTAQNETAANKEILDL